jgi:hypothetical protein
MMRTKEVKRLVQHQVSGPKRFPGRLEQVACPNDTGIASRKGGGHHEMRRIDDA